MGSVTKSILTAMYARMSAAFGPQEWWPARTRFEVIVGAILTQNTNWGNVEKAIGRLRSEKALSPRALRDMSFRKLASLIRPAGYFNVKARRLKNFISFFFGEYGGCLEKMAAEDWRPLRRRLLQVDGIGPETADSILLYALGKPVFVVDAYTKRMLYRHNMADRRDDYHAVQEIFMGALDGDVRMFNEYHALFVRLGKDYCRPRPVCGQCVLRDFRYSLTAKCGRCHRALPERRDRKPFRGGYLCRECRAP